MKTTSHAFASKSFYPGPDLFSRGPTSRVSSALVGLTTVFGMGTGVTPPLEGPRLLSLYTFARCGQVSADCFHMDDVVDATFARRLAAFAIDAFVVIGLFVLLTVALVVRALGHMPASVVDVARADAALDDVEAIQLLAPLLGYVVWSWSPLAGRRSLGKRALGLRVIRR